MVNGSDIPTGKKKIVKEEFSEARIHLQREVNRHPALMNLLEQYDRDDWAGMLGEISAFCGIGLDGLYMQHELEKLYEILYFKLRHARIEIIH